ncbi:MAG: MBG domain-containing protein, partial [Cyclobacteriaceae bacterium]
GEALLTISSDYSNTFERKIDIIPDYEVAKIVIENLRQTYDGDKKKVKVTTEPQDLKVQVTYNGSAELPVKTGEYLVQAQVVDHMYKGQAEELFTIEAAAAKVKFEKSSVVYDGQPKEIKVITEPKDLPFEILYEGEKEIPIDAGKYSVEVKITDPNYQGSATTEFNILPMEVTVSFSDLEHIFDGETKAATITTTPDNLDFSTIYYDLDTVENMPINAGKYLVNVVGNQPNYKISAWASLKVSKAEANFLINKSSFDYDGSIKKPEITSSPEEINFKIAYFNKDTIEMDPVNAGSYLLKVEATDKNYEGAFWASFQIMPAVAEIKTEYLNSVYTGTVPKISYTTQPADLKLSYNFYDQDTLAAEPINAGKYLVKAVIIDQNYTGEAWDEINIAPAVINFSFANSRVEFTGTTRAITVIPSLPDIDYKVTYWQDDKEVDPIETGKYQVQVTSWDHNYTGFAETTFVIKPAKLSFNFDQLIEEYTGNIISIKLTTEPADVAFTVEYFDLDTNAILPLEAGKYLVKASGSDKNYTGYAWSIFEVTPAAADIIFDQLTHKYDGNAKKAIVYTNPAGLNVRVQYNGQNTLPVKAGTYEISAVVEDQSFTGNEIASLKIEKAEAEVFVSDLVFADNEPEISVTTMPSGLNYQVSYVIDGDTTSAIPAEPGEYKIIIEIEDDNFQGRLVSSMIITGGLATDNEDIFQVYPNPVSDILNFNILENEMKVQLMDLNGKLVKDWYLLGEKSIDISPVPRGNYFIAIQAGKRTYTKRIIKL